MFAAINRDNHEDHPKKTQARNTTSPITQEDYIAQVSEEIKVRGTKKLSQEFCRTENGILGA